MRRVIAPLLSGDRTPRGCAPTTFSACATRAWWARDAPIRIAYPSYREVIPSDLTWTTQESLTHDPA